MVAWNAVSSVLTTGTLDSAPSLSRRQACRHTVPAATTGAANMIRRGCHVKSVADHCRPVGFVTFATEQQARNAHEAYNHWQVRPVSPMLQCMLPCASVSMSHVATAATHHCLNMVPLSSQPHLVFCADMKADGVPYLWQGFGQGGLMIEIISTDPGGPRPAPMAQQLALQQLPFQGPPAQRPPTEALGVTLRKPQRPDMNVRPLEHPTHGRARTECVDKECCNMCFRQQAKATARMSCCTI